MRQRNDTGQVLIVHTDPPQRLEPGGEIEHDTYVVGLTVLDEPDEATDVEQQPEQADATQKPTRTRSAGKEATS